MGTRDKRVDLYIAKAAPFARPILLELREMVHEGCPEVVEEIKWGSPFFMHKGVMCFMAGFTEHCVFGFWKRELMSGSEPEKMADGRGRFGRITSLEDLPAKKTMLGYIKKAKRLNDEGVKKAAPRKGEKKELEVPDYFTAALKKNKKALATFEAFAPSKKRDYVEWLTEAKTESTRQSRLKTSLEWLADGKSRNWKYEKS